VTYVQPLLLAFLLIASAGLVRMRKCRGVGLVAAGLASLFLLSWPPVDWLLSRPLEARYTRCPAPMESAQSIVVLGSSATPPEYGTPYFVPDKDMYDVVRLPLGFTPTVILFQFSLAAGVHPGNSLFRQQCNSSCKRRVSRNP
jgi:hypothetical protein